MSKLDLRTLSVSAVSLYLVVAIPSAGRGDWPAYRAGPSRGGYTAERLPGRLGRSWTYSLRHPPRPAWSGRDTRAGFDRSARVVVAEGLLYHGSSVDGTLRALDVTSGEEIWSFRTGAPLRLGATAAAGRVYVPSDDGYLYCLSGSDGNLLWKHRGGPGESWVVGNGNLISRWPVRGGPALHGGTLYFAAGIWPSEGIFLKAVDPRSGEVRWCNEKSGSLVMPQPHGGAVARSGISAQGDLVVCGDRLLVPTGRAVPAAFRLTDGELLYFHLQRYGHNQGGATIVGTGTEFLSGSGLFDVASGSLIARALRPETTAVTPSEIFSVAGDKLLVFDRAALVEVSTGVDRKGNPEERRTLSKPVRSWTAPREASTLIASGDALVFGQPDRVRVLDAGTGATRFEARVDGTPYDLAVSNERLFVSTDRGTIVCFSREPNGQPAVERGGGGPPASPSVNTAAGDSADEILRETGVSEGYCVLLGCDDGSLALELARRSKLRIYVVDADRRRVREARARFDREGLLGARVTVLEARPARSSLPSGFSDLVVSGYASRSGAIQSAEGEALRLARPYGGRVCLHGPEGLQVSVRGELEGGGSWTHQYADTANTGSSGDKVVRGPLGVRWFADLDFPMPNRHGRGPAPLFYRGRLFVEGLDGILCLDAYNGRKLWQVELPGILEAYDQDHLMGTAGTGSNFCVGEAGLFVRFEGHCLRIDRSSGKILGEIRAPPAPSGAASTWGYLALSDGALFGSLADTTHVVKWRYMKGDMARLFTESTLLFACDPLTGQIRWTFRPEESIRQNAIAVAAGRVYAIDRERATGDRLDAEGTGAEHPPGALLALDAATGNPLWRREGEAFGTMLIASERHDVLLVAYQATRFRLESELGGRMAAYRASDGAKLWDIQTSYRSRPVLVDRTIYAEPGSWDLLTGKPGAFKFERSYGCGIPAASRHLLVFRSATLGYVDLTRRAGTENYGGMRPGCWINAIPAGGLVLVPDATDGCVCSYLLKTSIALAPPEEPKVGRQANGGS